MIAGFPGVHPAPSASSFSNPSPGSAHADRAVFGRPATSGLRMRSRGLEPWDGPDDALLLHQLDEAGSAVVADLEPALEIGGAGLALLEHDLQGLLEQRIVLLVVEERQARRPPPRRRRSRRRCSPARPGSSRAPRRARPPPRRRRRPACAPGRRPGAVEYSMSPLPRSFSAPTMSMMMRESNLLATMKAMRLGMLALMRPVITSMRGPLGGQHEVDAHGPAHGGKPRQGALQLLAGGCHEVGELVDHDHDVGQASPRHIHVP